MKKKMLMISAAAAGIVAITPAEAQRHPRDPHELGYFLPKTRVAATVHQLIRRCPTPEQPKPLVTTTLAISERVVPDPDAWVRVDTRSNFLAARSIRLGLRQDGTLSSFNATSKGEGGEVLSSVISVGATLASFGAGMPIPAGLMANKVQALLEARREVRQAPPPPLTCTSEIEALVARMALVERDLADLRSRVAQGHESALTAQVMASLTTELSGLVDRLTLKPRRAADIDPQPSEFNSADRTLVRHLAPIDYSPWFIEQGASLQDGLAQSEIIGLHGFRVSLRPDERLHAVLGQGNVEGLGPQPTPYLYYRRPVPAVAAIVPCAAPASPEAPCIADESRAAAAASAQKRVLLPQLSGTFAIRAGLGRMFGSRTAAATFDEQGAPTVLEYGTSSGGSEIAGVIDSAGGAATTLRNAETTAINRRIEQIKAQRELEELLTQPSE